MLTPAERRSTADALVLTTRELRIAGSVVAGVCLLVGTVQFFVNHTSLLERCIQFLFFAALAAYMVGRIARCKVVASDTGLLIVNPFRTIRVPRGEIVSFRLGSNGMNPCIGMVDVRGAAGAGAPNKRISMFAIQAPQFGGTRTKRGCRASESIDALNAWLSQP